MIRQVGLVWQAKHSHTPWCSCEILWFVFAALCDKLRKRNSCNRRGQDKLCTSTENIAFPIVTSCTPAGKAALPHQTYTRLVLKLAPNTSYTTPWVNRNLMIRNARSQIKNSEFLSQGLRAQNVGRHPLVGPRRYFLVEQEHNFCVYTKAFSQVE